MREEARIRKIFFCKCCCIWPCELVLILNLQDWTISCGLGTNKCVMSERINDRIRDPFTAEKYIPGGYVPQLLKPAGWSPAHYQG